MKDVMDPWKYWGYDLAELCDYALVNLDNAKEIDDAHKHNKIHYEMHDQPSSKANT